MPLVYKEIQDQLELQDLKEPLAQVVQERLVQLVLRALRVVQELPDRQALRGHLEVPLVLQDQLVHKVHKEIQVVLQEQLEYQAVQVPLVYKGILVPLVPLE